MQGAGGVGHSAREIGGIAGTVGDGRRVLIDRCYCEVRRVLPGADRIAEGQRAGAGAAAIGGGAAVIERQRRRAAGYRHGSSKVERQGYRAAGVKIARAVADTGSRCHHRRYCRRRGVDLQYAGRVGHSAREIGGIAGAIGDGRGIGIDRRDRKVGVFWPAPTV